MYNGQTNKTNKMSTLVKNFDKLSRPIVYDGLKSKTCSPSDVDVMMEFYNKFLILSEIKEKGKDITVGQNICLTRIADAWNKASKDKVSVVIFAQHNPSDEVILLADCTINKVYMNGKWIDLSKKNINYKHFLQLFAEKHNIEHLNFNN
jgi:hypothetical protein